MEICGHILKTKNTVRRTAALFGVSKSTVHKDMRERLPEINEELAGKVCAVLEENKAERHIRGGEATKLKYKHSPH
jgi:putative DeoR family transcriptional regulator (stage III sporulation protein D)